MYSNEERLDIFGRIGVTKEVYEILREQKKEQKISLAKIVCNSIIKEYKNGIKRNGE